MSATHRSGGLGDVDPFNRAAASHSFIPNTTASQPASQLASETASKSANRGVAPPPPAPKRPARVQLNTRVLADRAAALDEYKRQNGTTMQALVDQMVDEYLAARGLL